MGRYRCIGLLVVLISIVISACQSGDLDVGQSVINPNELQVQSIDSVTIQTSTVIIPDSFVTSADSSILVGQWTDAQTGQLLAQGFTSVDYVTNDLDQTIDNTRSDVRLDSLVLELGYSFAYGDTASLFELGVYRLKTPLTTGQLYYNTNTAPYEANPLLTKTVVLHPGSGTRQIRFPIANDLAQSFFAKLVSGDINDATTLSEFWPGFAFVGKSTANSFAGFSTTSALTGLRLYYHTTDLDRTALSVRFPITSTHFSQLRSIGNGSLNALQQRSDQISSTATNHTTFVALGSSLCTRIELPYLGQFDKPEQFAGLNSAILVIEPIRRNLSDNTSPPSLLALYTTNSQNEILGSVPATATGGSAAVAAYSYDPNALELSDSYKFDLTKYISQIIRREIPNRPLLLTNPAGQSDLRTLIQRVTLGDQNRSTDRIRLRLLMTSGT
ncbi:DUF4270 family protein [Spirosoma soli]|uniref:DUF4270 family protein n=1 Tax=Spirosoma soli TaxID=1770529 RepID=A0ABW5LZ98_9BACT